MIKSWWAEKSTSEKQIVAALAVLSLDVSRWLTVIKPTVTYIEEISPSKREKLRRTRKKSATAALHSGWFYCRLFC